MVSSAGRGVVLQRPEGLEEVDLPGEWTMIRRSGDRAGIVLDAVLFGLWSAADGRDAHAMAEVHAVPRRLVVCATNVFRRSGLLLPDLPTPDRAIAWSKAGWSLDVTALLVHCDARGDVRAAYESVIHQSGPGLCGVTLISSQPAAIDEPEIGVRRCTPDSAVHVLAEEMAAAEGASVLVLDTRHRLQPGALAEMLYPQCVCPAIVAVAPRVVWDSWPSFAVNVGDWRDAEGVRRNPFAGQLDVAQFGTRWFACPGIHLSCAMVSTGALRAVGPLDSVHSLNWMGLEWAHRARMQGFVCLAATQAVARGPWPGPIDLAEETFNKLRFVWSNLDPERARFLLKGYRREDRRRSPHARHAARRGWSTFRQTQAMEPRGERRRRRTLPRLPAPGEGARVHEGSPVLTVDIVRSLCLRFRVLDPRPPREEKSRIALVSTPASRRESLVASVEPLCDARIVKADKSDDGLGLECEEADGLIVSAEAIRSIAFLQRWPRPILVDVGAEPLPRWPTQSLEAGSVAKQGRAWGMDTSWLASIDGLICASEEQRLFWLGRLAACGRLSDVSVVGSEGILGRVVVVPEPSDACPGCWNPIADPRARLTEAAPGGAALAPAGLQAFCERPEVAFDRQVRIAREGRPTPPAPVPTPIRRLPRKLLWALRDEGPGGATRQVLEYLIWMVRQ